MSQKRGGSPQLFDLSFSLHPSSRPPFRRRDCLAERGTDEERGRDRLLAIFVRNANGLTRRAGC